MTYLFIKAFTLAWISKLCAADVDNFFSADLVQIPLICDKDQSIRVSMFILPYIGLNKAFRLERKVVS